MRILITNNTLAGRAGTELYCRDIALALAAAGHEPLLYSTMPGEVAAELKAAGIAVYDRLDAIPGTLDLIHGHHRLETTVASLAFPSAPVISFCHGPRAFEEEPCRLPSVAFWVAVDEACRERLVATEGIPAGRIEVLYNFVDTDRFPLRPPLPDPPRRALAFSNAASESTHLPLLRAVCAGRGLALDVAGMASGNPVREPEALLPRYDLVFAKARAALEAMAVGCAVVQCDHIGAGRLVTTANFDALRPLNFGFRSLTFPLEARHLAAEIAGYDPADARRVAERVRRDCSLAATMPRLLALYEKALAAGPAAPEAVRAAGIRFIEGELAWIKGGRRAAAAGRSPARPAKRRWWRRLVPGRS